MSQEAPAAAEPLQFDNAEYESSPPSSVTCATCQTGLSDTYFELNGNVICTACREALERSRSGSGVGRFLRAAAAGCGAALVGSLLYYAIRALTGYEIGLISILVGLMVGAAVRWGSRRRGGWRYQALAMLLTYASIVGNYIPDIIKTALAKDAAPPAAASTDSAATASATSPGAIAPAPGPPAAAAPAGQAAPGAAAQPSFLEGLGMLLLGLGALILFAFAVPFLAGFENIIGILIIAFGLYEAWKLNRKVPEVMTGPYRVGGKTSASPEPEPAPPSNTPA